MASPGAISDRDGVDFAVWSADAERIWLCLFDSQDRETDRLEMMRGDDAVWRLRVEGLRIGARYGFRADGPYRPQEGLCFDPAKLLADPYARRIDRPYGYDPRLAAKRGEGPDTAPLMPKAVVEAQAEPMRPLGDSLKPGAVIYELPVRAFTMRHPQIPEALRGTLPALAEPPVLDHLSSLRVDAVELMPIAAWIDERHLPPLGLRNAWGYNPVTMMALDPRLAPNGIADLRKAVEALHGRGIAVILDVVFNHTGESDAEGPTLSMRGFGERSYYRRGADGTLINDTGTGNMLDCSQPVVQALILDAMRYFVRVAGIDGFRFDLAPVLGRSGQGFDPDAELLRAIVGDPVLGRRILVAEPWDIGPGGYQLGNLPPPFLEWNDRYRDDARRFWRGDDSMLGALATRLAGSSDIFGRSGRSTRSVNFIAAHDGMTLADLTAYAHKHNQANGEDNRDGHDDNLSWNNGVEGESGDPTVREMRRRDVKALLATLLLSRGTLMLTAGDEFGRTQNGNNNAYAQDNETTWLDWEGRDLELEGWARDLAALRNRFPQLRQIHFLEGDVEWLDETARPMTPGQWEEPSRRTLAMVLQGQAGDRVAVLVNGGSQACRFGLAATKGAGWRLEPPGKEEIVLGRDYLVAARSVAVLSEIGET